jgi:hypothetical protein
MGAQDQSNFAFSYSPSMGSLTLTGAGNETIRVPAPTAVGATLQAVKLSAGFAIADVWRPVGIAVQVTTATTGTAATVILRKNGVSAATGGVATIPIQAIDATQYFYFPFSAYTFAAADAAGDKWSVAVGTTSATGVVNPTFLAFAWIRVPGINEGVAI